MHQLNNHNNNQSQTFSDTKHHKSKNTNLLFSRVATPYLPSNLISSQFIKNVNSLLSPSSTALKNNNIKYRNLSNSNLKIKLQNGSNIKLICQGNGIEPQNSNINNANVDYYNDNLIMNCQTESTPRYQNHENKLLLGNMNRSVMNSDEKNCSKTNRVDRHVYMNKINKNIDNKESIQISNLKEHEQSPNSHSILFSINMNNSRLRPSKSDYNINGKVKAILPININGTAPVDINLHAKANPNPNTTVNTNSNAFSTPINANRNTNANNNNNPNDHLIIKFSSNHIKEYINLKYIKCNKDTTSHLKNLKSNKEYPKRTNKSEVRSCTPENRLSMDQSTLDKRLLKTNQSIRPLTSKNTLANKLSITTRPMTSIRPTISSRPMTSKRVIDKSLKKRPMTSKRSMSNSKPFGNDGIANDGITNGYDTNIEKDIIRSIDIHIPGNDNSNKDEKKCDNEYVSNDIQEHKVLEHVVRNDELDELILKENHGSSSKNQNDEFIMDIQNKHEVNSTKNKKEDKKQEKAIEEHYNKLKRVNLSSSNGYITQGFRFFQEEFEGLQDDIKNLNEKLNTMDCNSDDNDDNNDKKDDLNKICDNNIVKYEFLKVNPKKLTSIELDYIHKEYDKVSHNRSDVDWDKLDSILSKLKFFSKHMKETRISLLRRAKYLKYQPGHIIFRQGDFGDLMYIILSGSVNVRSKLLNPYGNIEEMIVACLYDGDAFGELAMLSTTKLSKGSGENSALLIEKLAQIKSYQQIKQENKKNKLKKVISMHKALLSHSETRNLSLNQSEQLANNNPLPSNEQNSKNDKRGSKELATATVRAATIEVAQGISLLAIPRQHFRDILLPLMQKELDRKVKILNRLPFFDHLEPLNLLPVANNLKIKKFKINDVILKAGDLPTFFGIVAKGRCHIIVEKGSISKDIQSVPYMKGYMTSLKNFSFSKNQQSLTSPSTKRRSISSSLSALNSPNQDIKPNNIKAHHHQNVHSNILVTTLTTGYYFGTRVLLSDIPNELTHTFEEINNFKAKLTIIAGTNDVEIYKLDRKHLKYIPDFLQRTMIDGVSTEKDFDDCDILNIKKDANTWNASKQNVAYESLYTNYLQRLKDQAKTDFKKF